MNHETEIITRKKELMKGPSVKDNQLILKRYYSASLFHLNPIMREGSRGEGGYRASVQREAENRGGSVSFRISYLKG